MQLAMHGQYEPHAPAQERSGDAEMFSRMNRMAEAGRPLIDKVKKELGI